MIEIINDHTFKNENGHYQSKIIYDYPGSVSGIISTSPEMTTEEASKNYLDSMIRSTYTMGIEYFFKNLRGQGCDTERLFKALLYFLDNKLSIKEISEYLLKMEDMMKLVMTHIKLPARNEYLNQLNSLINFAKEQVK